MKKHVRFSTGPFTPSTHWQQTVLYFDNPIFHLKEGEHVNGSIAVRKGQKNFRELDIKFSVHHERRDSRAGDDTHQVCQLKLR